MFEGFRRQRITVGDVEIACVVGGAGPPVLMLHGFPQCLAMWAHVAPRLARDFTVVCADLRGYGDSAKPRATPDADNYSFRSMAADQLGVMKRLGFDRFHAVGHDRGGRTAYRMALDHAPALLSLSVIDIVPTYAMFMATNRKIAGAYWHWYFLSQPAPFAERMIGYDPDLFYETCLVGWGAAKITDFDPELLAEYRRCWRNPGMIHGSCADYRAAATIDLGHDTADIGRKVGCPVLVFYGAKGVIAGLYDVPAEWREHCATMTVASLPGGHFFIDQFPAETADVLARFLKASAAISGDSRPPR
jgi:haloacetate dehalogenase